MLCPFPDCLEEHSVADCSRDVTLKKAVEAISEIVRAQAGFGSGFSANERDVRGCGRLAWTYFQAKAGLLQFDEEAIYPDEADDGTDARLLEDLKEVATPEMDCQVCLQLLFDPVTTHCGHTFCRRCLQQGLDHSPLCPTCRKPLHLPANVPATLCNRRITEILTGLCPEALAQRAAAVSLETNAGAVDQGLETPIFVCTSSFPGMPTPLFIFEPRYRLMIRRAWEGNKRFGMVLPNRTGEVQGELGQTPFMQYGTLLRIEDIQMYADGRSHVWTVGESKFKIKRWGYRDEYIVADTERFDDLPVAEEEALEALQTARVNYSPNPPPAWTRLSTHALLQTGHEFIHQMQTMSAAWIQEGNIMAFGPPPVDPAMFPYWLASVLPVADEEKYRLITSPSVRTRLIIVVSWIKRIESQRWFANPIPYAAPVPAMVNVEAQ